jgi:hypothetical protein
VVTSATGCAQEQADEGSAADKILGANGGKLGCPRVFVEQNVRATRGPGLWEIDETNCYSIDKLSFPSPVDFELFLSKHPHSSLGLKGPTVAFCLNQYLSDNISTATRFYDLPRDKQDYAERAAVSDYYFTMNTMRQATRGALEAIAALDFLSGVTPVLPDNPRDADDKPYPSKYVSAFAVDSEEWTRDLRACAAPTDSPFAKLLKETRDHLVMMSYIRVTQALIDHDKQAIDLAVNTGRPAKVWYKQWDAAAQAMATQNPAALRASFEADEKALDAQYRGHRAVAPWLGGKHMTSLLSAESVLGMSFYSYDESGSYVTQALLDLRNKSPEELVRWVGERVDARLYAPTSNSIATLLRKQIKENRKLLSEKLGRVYEAAECIHGTETKKCLSVVNEVMQTWPNFDGSGFRAQELPEETEVMQRLLQSTDADKRALGERLKDRRQKNNASVAGMFAAECRSDLRENNAKIEELKVSFAESVVITLATAGLGSWLGASKAALATAQGARAASLTVRVQALNGVLLAADAYWLGDGVVSAMKSCDQYLNHNLENAGLSPLGEKRAYCRTGQEALGGNDQSTALGPTAVADYRACAFDASLNVLVNTIGIVPSAVGFKNAFKKP